MKKKGPPSTSILSLVWPLLAALLATAPLPARAADGDDCAAPAGLLAIAPTLPHVAARIERGEPVTVVTVGSSSTEGVGASRPEYSYPSRLKAELMQRLPGVTVQVVNKGKGGEDAPEELARLNRDVLAEHPDLVIWQVGTNAVLRRDDLANDAASIRRGVAMLKSAGVDVVLMDLQYAPRVIARPAYAEMEKVIAKAAADSEVGLFRRFDIMQYWEAAIPADRGQMIGPDGLHMTDRGYGCLASDIAEAVAERWRTYHRSGPGQRSLAGVHAAKAVDPGSLLVP